MSEDRAHRGSRIVILPLLPLPLVLVLLVLVLLVLEVALLLLLPLLLVRLIQPLERAEARGREAAAGVLTTKACAFANVEVVVVVAARAAQRKP